MRTEEKYHEPILAILTEKGALGVNAIAQAIDMPLTSVHKYLKRQNYFRQNSNRKWDLPENVTEEFKETVTENKAAFLVTALESQAVLIQTQVEALQSQMEIMVNQTTAIKPLIANYKPSVAAPTPIDPRISEFLEELKVIGKAVVSNKEMLPKNYREELTQVNWIQMGIDKGLYYMRNDMGPAIAGLMVGDTDMLENDIFDVIMQYKKKS